VSDLPVIAIRFALYADLMVLAGLTAFSLYAPTGEERRKGMLPLPVAAVALAVLGLVLSALGMLVLVAAMTGSSLFAVDRETLLSIVEETPIGAAWIVRMVAAGSAVAFSLSLGRLPKTGRVGLLLSASLAIATLVWTGHAGATEGWPGAVHRVSDIVHMLAASIWIGGIAAFGWLLFQPLARQSNSSLITVHRALEQFSRVGTVSIALIVATGILNGLILFGLPGPDRMLASPYGRLLLAKLGLFVVMLMLAAANRWRLTPALGAAIDPSDAAAAVGGLRRSLLAEAMAALAILGLVAWLGTLEPPGR